MISLYKISYFSEPYSHSKNQIKVELHLPDYATKSDSKGATNIITRKFAKEAYLRNLKSDVDFRCWLSDVDYSVDLSNPSNVVKRMLLKKVCVINWLKKVMQLIPTKKVLKKKIEDVHRKMPNTSKFIVIKELDKLTKINFHGRMAEASRNFETKKQTLDFGDKNGEKIKKPQFNLSLRYFIRRS